MKWSRHSLRIEPMRVAIRILPRGMGSGETLLHPHRMGGCRERLANRPQDSVRIERNAPASSIGLGIVEFAFVESLYDFDSIRMNSLPTQSRNLPDPQRTHNHEGNDGFCGFWQPFDYTAYILLCEHDRRLPCLLAWQPDTLRGIGAN